MCSDLIENRFRPSIFARAVSFVTSFVPFPSISNFSRERLGLELDLCFVSHSLCLTHVVGSYRANKTSDKSCCRRCVLETLLLSLVRLLYTVFSIVVNWISLENRFPLLPKRYRHRQRLQPLLEVDRRQSGTFTLVSHEKVVIPMHGNDENPLVVELLHHRVVARWSEVFVAGAGCWRARSCLRWLQVLTAIARLLGARHDDEKAEQGGEGCEIPNYGQGVHAERFVVV